jgi:hypothetical protein
MIDRKPVKEPGLYRTEPGFFSSAIILKKVSTG